MANNNQKQVFDLQPSAGMPAGVSNEIQRRWTERSWDQAVKHGNYDRTRSRLNFEVVKGGKVQPIDPSRSIPGKIRDNLKARGIEDPNVKKEKDGKKPNRRTVVNIILGGSREQMRRLAFGDEQVEFDRGTDNSHIERCPDIERWAQAMYAFACGKWGEENVVSFVVHLDELNPHSHLTLLPIDENNKFSFKRLFHGEDKFTMSDYMKQLHDEIAEVNRQFGLERGDSILETGARHRSTEEYRRDLRKDCNELESKNAALDKEIQTKQRTLFDLNAEIRMAETRVKGLTTMVQNLESKETELSAQIAELEQEIATGIGDASDLRQRIGELTDKLRATTNSLNDKREKLRTANQQLAELAVKKAEKEAETQAISERNATLSKQTVALAGDMQDQMRKLLLESVAGKTLMEYGRLADCLTPEQKAQAGNNFVMHLAEQPGEIMECAMMLMAGYVDGAIQFAETHGGGGEQGQGLRWGRDPNEDDHHFAFRCMLQAHKLMKPSHQYRRGYGR